MVGSGGNAVHAHVEVDDDFGVVCVVGDVSW